MLCAVGPVDTASVHFVVSMLNLQIRVVQQDAVRLEFDLCRSVNEAIAKFAANKTADCLVVIDKLCTFSPGFVFDNATDDTKPLVLGVCPQPRYSWDRLLKGKACQEDEPYAERVLEYNVDLRGMRMNHKMRLTPDLDADRVAFTPGLVVHRKCMDALAQKFPERFDGHGNAALFVEEMRGGKFYDRHANFLDLYAQCGGTAVADLGNPMGIQGTVAFEGACSARAILR